MHAARSDAVRGGVVGADARDPGILTAGAAY